MRKENSIRLGDVLIDSKYQVRRRVETQKVSEYSTAMKLGNVFPPIVIELETGKLLCGFTRYDAYLQSKMYGPNDKIPATWKSFSDEKSRVFFAAKENSTHGYGLNAFDKINIIGRLHDLGATAEEISKALGWSFDRVAEGIDGRLTLIKDYDDEKETKKRGRSSKKLDVTKKASVDEDKPKWSAWVMVDGEAKPLKSGHLHLHKTVMTKEVYENMEQHYIGFGSDAGMFVMGQLIMRIDDGTLNLSDDKVVKKLKTLKKKLNSIC